ncbi:hypothetical protein [Chitinophaga varians]|uniref:hypothetical protein n=1 Tax=Chitinophaga varians TaxID=2202339 RepID=UPI00165FD2C2|nr:hypothetical protein [Chitinophaga varians]MBC9909869.1 hypothetical protein [Chitinophaga varians]
MKKLWLFVSFVTVGIFVATLSSFGSKGDKNIVNARNDHRSSTTTLATTYYPSAWNGVAIQPGDAGFMYTRTYLVNYASSTATLMNGPTYAMFALSETCRYEWLNSSIDPSCTSGCRTWSYYYHPAPTFTANINYLAVACFGGGGVDFFSTMKQ